MRIPAYWPLLLILIGLAAAAALPATSLAQSQGSPIRPVADDASLLWKNLGPARQAVLRPFESQWNGWTASDRRLWMQVADRFPELDAGQKTRTIERIAQWWRLSPHDRLVARRNYQLARDLKPAERIEEWERYNSMTPEQRSVLRSSGSVSNTAAGNSLRSGLAPDAAQPLAPLLPARHARPEG
ncbi:MAG: DUF3106 domain-containing protein, partial [Burkholderiaceae bacterium]